MRVLYLGDSMAGKTSLAETILSDQFFLTAEEDRTIVAKLNHWIADKEQKKIFTFIDLGGQKAYLSSGHYFNCNTRNHVGLVCHDISQPKYGRTFVWLKSMLTRAPESHIRIALTKGDLLSGGERVASKERFCKALQNYLLKEIELLEVCLLMATDEKEKMFKAVVDKYKWLETNLQQIVFITSCKEAETINCIKEQLIAISDEEENQISLPEHYKKLYQQIGKLGILQPDDSDSDTDKLYSKTDSMLGTGPKPIPPISSKQYLKFDELRELYRDILVDINLPTDNIEDDLKRCLHFLHVHGLLLYFSESKILQNYIFHDIKAFVLILRCVFYHEINNCFKYKNLSPLLRVECYLNNESNFNADVNLLQKKGLLSKALLKVLLSKSNCDLQPDVVFELLNMVEVGFTFTPKDMDPHIFIPYFLESNEIPHELKDKLEDIELIEENMLSLTCKIKGSLPPTFWHFLVGRLFKELQHSMHSAIVWARGFWTILGSKKIKMALLHEIDDTIKFVIKGSIADIEGHRLIWQYIQVICEEAITLREVWWPGLVSSLVILCIACLIKNQNSEDPIVNSQLPNVAEFSLERVIKEGEESDKESDSVCTVDSLQVFPAGLIKPLCKDPEEAEKMLVEVQNYLRANGLKRDRKPEVKHEQRLPKHLTAKTQMTSESEEFQAIDNSDLRPIQTPTTSSVREEEIQPNDDISETENIQKKHQKKKHGRVIQMLTKPFKSAITKFKGGKGPQSDRQQKYSVHQSENEDQPSVTDNKQIVVKQLDKVITKISDMEIKMSHENRILSQQLFMQDKALHRSMTEQHSETNKTIALHGKSLSSLMSGQIGGLDQKMTQQNAQLDTRMMVQNRELSNQMYVQGKAISTQMHLLVDASNYPLKCIHPVLAPHQELLLEHLEPNSNLLDNLFYRNVLSNDDKKAIEADRSVVGKVKRVLIVVESKPESIKGFIDALNDCQYESSNFTLASRLRDAYNHVTR